MNFYDAHSHLHFSENKLAAEEFLENPNLFVCACSVSAKDMDDLQDFAAKAPKKVFTAYGVHPWFISGNFDEDDLRKFLVNASALGEIGLDKRANTDYDLQLEFFEAQLNLASDLELPVVIHCVEAWGDLLRILKTHRLKKGFLLHSAKCSPEVAKELSALGGIFSFGLRELSSIKGLTCAASLETDKILVESDADSKIADLQKAMSILAELKGLSLDLFSEEIEKNFLKFFKNDRL